MKPFLLTIGLLALVTAICCGTLGYILGNEFNNLEYEASLPYTLAERDGKLVVLNNQALVKVLRNAPQSTNNISTSVQPKRKDLGYEFVINSGTKRYRHSAMDIDHVIATPDKSSICFIATSPAKQIPLEYERQVWMWTEATGFKQISLKYAHLTNLIYSQDGKKVTASIRDINFNASNRFLVCTLDGKRETTFTMPKPQKVDMQEGMSPILFSDGSVALVDDQYPKYVCLWNTEDETTKPLDVQGKIVYAYCYRGQIWGVRQVTSRERDIVRLSPDLKRIEEVVKL